MIGAAIVIGIECAPLDAAHRADSVKAEACSEGAFFRQNGRL